MKVVLKENQIAYILKNKRIVIDGKPYSFDKKAMTKLRKLVKLRSV